LPTTAVFRSASRRERAATGGRASAVALGLAALIATSSDAFALKIPIQANLSGGGEVPSNNSPAKGVMEGTFDTDTNTLTWTVTYSGLSSPAVAAHFHGPISYLGLTPEENARSERRAISPVPSTA
jgi:CHRD domain